MGKLNNETLKIESSENVNEDSMIMDEEKKDNEADLSFQELFEESLKEIHEGKLVRGEIVQIDKEFVLVDVGYKSEGQIRITEFINNKGELTAKVGDKVDVLLVRKENRDGRIILSKEKAAREKIWDEVQKACEMNDTVRGKIIAQVKGGLSVDIGLQAFLPGSQADIRPVRNLGSLIGTEFDFRVLKCERQQGNIVLSRRALLEEEQKDLREKTLKKIEEGAIIDGIVSNIADYGLFIDLGGIDGLVHITEISWAKVRHPSDLYKVGDQITVKILEFDKENGKVSLSIKQLKPNPWTKAKEKYPPGTRITGKVTALKEYGAFVEIEEGMEGMVHVSEMSWSGKIKHPSQLLNTGTSVEAVVLDLDADKKRISLSIKQLEPNPWDSIAENYPVGTILEGKIKNITDFGIFVGIDEGIDGLIHVSDLSWSKRISHPAELYKKGDDVQAVVLDIDKEGERFSLGIKQLTKDPWDLVHEKYQLGKRVTGIIKGITEFGIFLELEEGVEGLIHISQLSKGNEKNNLEAFEINDSIEAEVVNISKEDKKIGLSIKKLEENSERDALKGYTDSQKQATSNLGDLLKEKMMKL